MCIFLLLLQAAAPSIQKINLPHQPGQPVSMDYLAYDRDLHRLWVPAGNTASVDVVDAGGKITPIDGLPIVEREVRGEKRWVGPSSVTIGGGLAFVGNRADASVCSFDANTLKPGGCIILPSPPDGLAFVAKTQEVWVTTPRSKSLTILNVSNRAHPTIAAIVPLAGKPEGYGVDQAAARFFTNLEDANQTLVVDVVSRKVMSELHPGCGDDGPRGLAVDAAAHLVYVACTDHLAVLDPTSDKILSTLPTGVGLDNIDYLPSEHLVYAAAGKDARLTVARVDAHGRLSEAWRAPTTDGTRVVVADEHGTAYVADAKGGVIWVVPRPAKRD